MPSSTSNSEPRKTLKYIAGLLVALAVGQAILEFGATWVMRKYGKNEIRWADERKAAASLTPDGRGVLLIGSSVLLGINPTQLQQEMPDWTVRRTVMVGTFYTDWDYSLRRMAREGVKPRYVVLVPMPFQIYGDGFRGDYLPLHYIDRRDIPDLAEQKKLDLTSISNLYFASVNSFFALRDDVRNAFLGNLIPGHKVLAAGAPNRRTYTDEEIEKLIGDRLATLQSRLAAQGASLIVLHYPAPNQESSWAIVKRVADAHSIPYVSPVESMPANQFEDVYHLNPQGAEAFTTALGPALNEALGRIRATN